MKRFILVIAAVAPLLAQDSLANLIEAGNRKAALETAKREEAERRQYFEDLEKEGAKQEDADSIAAQRNREQAFPEAKLGREQSELYGLFQRGKIDVEELSMGLADAAKKFADEMDRRNPFKKMQEEATKLLESADPGKKLDDVIGHRVHRVHALGNGRLAMAPQVRGDDSVNRPDPSKLLLPHRPAQGKPVQQNHDRAWSLVRISQIHRSPPSQPGMKSHDISCGSPISTQCGA